MGCGCGNKSSNSTSASLAPQSSLTNLTESEIDAVILQTTWYVANQGGKLADKAQYGELCDECVRCLALVESRLDVLKCYVYPINGTITILGGNATSWDIYVDGILIGNASFIGTNPQRATNLALAINLYKSEPEWTAVASGNKVTIYPATPITGSHIITYKAYGGVVDPIVVNPKYDGCLTLLEIKKIVDDLSKIIY
jgi:hypothetical protein